jgi:hypothetical protein
MPRYPSRFSREYSFYGYYVYAHIIYGFFHKTINAKELRLMFVQEFHSTHVRPTIGRTVTDLIAQAKGQIGANSKTGVMSN